MSYIVARIKVKVEYVTDQIDNLTREYSPWLIEYEVVTAGSWNFTYFDAKDKKRKKLITLSHFAKGLTVMATESPNRFGNVVTGDSDALDADAFVQCAIFGKLIYG